MLLTSEQKERYKRQLLLKEIGEEGQNKLRQAKVLVIGAGGLGSPASFYLAAAGVGTIGIVDKDLVELSNLQRQILHSTADLQKPKTASAQEKLTALNPEVEIITYPERLTFQRALEIVPRYDIVLSCVDNFSTRYLLNDACVALKVPLVEGGVMGWEGRLMFITADGPCYRCLFPENDFGEEKKELGIIGVAPGIIGILEANEAIKYILGLHNLKGRLLLIDLLNLNFRLIKVKRLEECPVCGAKNAE